MTDCDYEKMMVEAANGKTQNAKAEIGILDERIKEQARYLDRLMERRRELINRFNLNKCDHVFDYNPKDMCGQCIKCGVQRHA